MKKVIYAADDDEVNRRILKTYLEAFGLETHVFEGAEEMIEATTKTLPDLFLVDYMMPNLNGIEAIPKIREISGCAHLPYLILTGKGDRNTVVEAFRYGADGFLVKPVEKDGLQKALAPFLMELDLAFIRGNLKTLTYPDDTLLKQSGIMEYAHLGAKSFPIIVDNLNICFLVLNNILLADLVSGSVATLEKNLIIFAKTQLGWRSIWPKSSAGSDIPEETDYVEVE